MESLYTIIVIACIFVIALVYVCIRISAISSGQGLEHSETSRPSSTPVIQNTIEELESRLSRLKELPAEDLEIVHPKVSHCIHCEAVTGRLRAEEKLAREALYPHLQTNNFLVRDGH